LLDERRFVGIRGIAGGRRDVFNPRLEMRLSGREAVLAFLEKIPPATPIPGHELIGPLVQPVGKAPC
jgi:hypothetical protein